MDKKLGERIIALRQRVVGSFDHSNWEEVGLLTGHTKRSPDMRRLLRSLSWSDEDFAGNALTVVRRIAENDPEGSCVRAIRR
jgi:hypothetical protein